MVILAIAMVGLWLWVLGILPLKKTVTELIERPVTVEVTPEQLRKRAEETATSLSDWLEKQEKIDRTLVYHEGPRNPLLLTVKEKKKAAKESVSVQPPRLELKGIAWDETEPLALINDLLVKEGDNIEGARIVKIDFGQVAVRYGSERFVIKLIEWEEKTKG